MKTCSYDGCPKPSEKRGMCHAHYMAWYRASQKASRQRFLDRYVIPFSGRDRLARDVAWIGEMLAQNRELRELAAIGQRWQAEQQKILAEKQAAVDALEKVQKAERKRAQRRAQKRRRRARHPDDPQRVAWAAAHLAKPSTPQAPRDTAFDTASPATPDLPVARPSAFAPVQSARAFPAAPGRDSGSFNEALVIQASFRSTPTAASPRGKGSADLLERIKRTGYTVDSARGLVLYDNTRWLTPEEWERKNPGALS
jgi:hypothetical protein